MDYRTITDRDSEQYVMQQSAATGECGVRKFNEDYMVAMGTFYAERAGERFRIALDSGSVFTVITGDIKNPTHTDSTNRYSEIDGSSGNLLEFIVDGYAVDNMVVFLGDVSYYDKFEGDIVSIEYLGYAFE